MDRQLDLEEPRTPKAKPVLKPLSTSVLESSQASYTLPPVMSPTRVWWSTPTFNNDSNLIPPGWKSRCFKDAEHKEA
jgi:hypothetical protein